MRRLLLLTAVFGLSFAAVECPNNFEDDGSGTCYSPILIEAQRTIAYRLCAQNNASLYIISNAFMNNKVQTMASNSDKIWIGLTCLNNTIASCTWDNGNVLTTNVFNNFFGGSPNATAGACTYMQVSNGKWYSTPCSNTMLWMGCQYTPGTPQVPNCHDKTSAYFNGKCYFEVSASSYDSASKMCQAGCATVASIHDDGSNSFVRDSTPNGQDSILIGLFRSANKNYYWDDGSSYDYSNFGREDGSGNCVSMALKDAAKVKKGQWTNTPCNLTVSNYVLCEKNVNNLCDDLATAPTRAPLMCDAPISLPTSGTFYSPGYPRTSEENTCEYLISELNNKQAYVQFNDLFLNAESSISLYSSFNQSDVPFITLTNVTNGTQQIYYSMGNNLRIVYATDGAPSTTGIPVNKFSAFNGYYSGDCGRSGDFLYMNSARFTSSDYPSNYQLYNNEWCLRSTKKRVQLTFADFFTDAVYSYVYVKDGNGALLLQLSGGPLSNITVTSITETMTVYFSTGNSGAKRGFSASFISID